MAQFKSVSSKPATDTLKDVVNPKAAPGKPVPAKAVQSKAALINDMKRRDSVMVRGRFVYDEVPGGQLVFRYRRYAGIPVKFYSLQDGQVYSIPRGVATHLATTGRYKVNEHATDENGKPTLRVSRMKKRYSFESLEFFDDGVNDTQESRLYSVEKVIDTGF